MSLSRRKFLGSVSAGAVATFAFGCDSETGGTQDPNEDAGVDAGADAGGPPLTEVPVDKASFAHGVASGDPFQDSVLLWTRVTTSEASVKLSWVVATDAELRNVVAMGDDVETSAARDYTVKVIAEGLTAGTTYYYAFFLSDDARSTLGRTRTLPTQVDHARIAFTSCANYGNGYFHAYRNLAARADLDVWLHLGDYIYEYANTDYSDLTLTDRTTNPVHECLTQADYRLRYANWRSDLDLQEMHRQHPLIVVWDDHEVANNAWKDGAENHQENEGDYQERKRGAIAAFLEWLPIRVEDSEETPKIYRQFAFGDLFDLIMLDTRQLARDLQAGTDAFLPNTSIDVGDPAVWNDPNRTLLGAEQQAWFEKALSDSKARGASWRVVGNQIIFSRARDPRDTTMPKILFSDFWDGYKPAQKHVLDHISNNAIDNVVFLTGDIHTSWAFEVSPDPFTDPYDPQSSVAVEFVGPSVTSLGLEDRSPTQLQLFGGLLLGGNPQLKYLELTKKGYVIVDITPERVQADWFHINDIKQKVDFGDAFAKAFVTQSGAPQLTEATAATSPKANPPALAPEEA